MKNTTPSSDRVRTRFFKLSPGSVLLILVLSCLFAPASSLWAQTTYNYYGDVFISGTHGNLQVGGTATLQHNLQVSGTSLLNNLQVSGLLSSNLQVSGTVDLLRKR
jgi:hypothetical protein